MFVVDGVGVWVWVVLFGFGLFLVGFCLVWMGLVVAACGWIDYLLADFVGCYWYR